jgi:hypothetical protein
LGVTRGVDISERGISDEGELSGVTAVVENYITNTESENSNYTLYIKYKSSSDTNFIDKTFVDGENLISLEDVDYTLSSIRKNTSFATSIISKSVGKGSAAKIEQGVYFIRGFFITVPKQIAILDQYTNTPTYRVGLLIDEEEFEISPAISRQVTMFEVDTKVKGRYVKIDPPRPNFFNLDLTFLSGVTQLSEVFRYTADLKVNSTDNVDSYSVYINNNYYGSDTQIIQITTNDILRIEVTKINNNQEALIIFDNKLV